MYLRVPCVVGLGSGWISRPTLTPSDCAPCVFQLKQWDQDFPCSCTDFFQFRITILWYYNFIPFFFFLSGHHAALAKMYSQAEGFFAANSSLH